MDSASPYDSIINGFAPEADSAAARSAFVLQVRALRSGFVGRLCGNVEHPASGSAASFASLAELASFIDRTLKNRGPEGVRLESVRDVPARTPRRVFRPS